MDAVVLQISSGRELFMVLEGGKKYTLDDIIALPDGERAELIDGEMFMMASPMVIHQNIVMWMSAEIYNFVRGKKGKCRVFSPSCAVFIKNDNKNYVEPDITVICDRDKLDDQGCHGAPDWVIEIVSPSSVIMDYKRKTKLYREAGVREYWIADSKKEKMMVYLFEGGAIKSCTEYTFTDIVPSNVIEGLKLDLNEMMEYIMQ